MEIQLFTFRNITDRIRSSIVAGAGIPRLGRNSSARRSRRGGRRPRPRLRGPLRNLWLSACVFCLCARIFLIFKLSQPFTGLLHISPAALEQTVDRQVYARPSLDGGQLGVKIKQTSPENPRKFQGVLRLAAGFEAYNSIRYGNSTHCRSEGTPAFS